MAVYIPADLRHAGPGIAWIGEVGVDRAAADRHGVAEVERAVGDRAAGYRQRAAVLRVAAEVHRAAIEGEIAAHRQPIVAAVQ